LCPVVFLVVRPDEIFDTQGSHAFGRETIAVVVSRPPP